MSDSVSEVIPILRENLEISEHEAKILLPLYLSGNMTAGGVSLHTGIKLSTVNRVLGSLLRKGLVLKLEGIVEVYRVSNPSLGIADKLTELLSSFEDCTSTVTTDIEQESESIEASTTTLIDEVKKVTSKTRDTLETYETNIMEAVQSQIESMANLSSSALSKFSEDIEKTLSLVDTTLDTDLGTKLLELQSELDKTQKSFEKDSKSIAKELDTWVKTEGKSSIDKIAEFNTSATTCLEAIKTTVGETFDKSGDSIRTIAIALADELDKKTSDISQDAANSYEEVIESLSEAVEAFQVEITNANTTALESLKSIIDEGKSIASNEGKYVLELIMEASDSISATSQNLESWREEVNGFVENTSRSISTQLEQISSTDVAYLDAIKTSISGYLEKLTTILNSEFSELRTLTSTILTDFESYLNSTRNSVMNLYKRQMKTDQRSLEKAKDTAALELDNWNVSTSKALKSKLTSISKDIDDILSTESAEFISLAENMDSRLKSSFNTAIASASSKNQSIITGIKRSTQDFETSIGTTLNEIVSSFSAAGTNHYENIGDIYGSLSTQLDERVTGSVATLSSLVDKAQKEIAKTIDDQTSRIDDYASGIRDEFHQHIEDMTKQFIVVTENLEATFNGLVSSQTIEARDLIASVHSEFRNAIRSEMSILQDDSFRLQKEYSMEINQRLDAVSTSISSLKKSLEEFVGVKRTEISQSMAQTLEKVEASVVDTQTSLKEMENGTIKQLGDSLLQLSKEYETSVNATRNQISERVEIFSDETESSLKLSVDTVKSTLDSLVTKQIDAKDRYVTRISKKIDTIASRKLKDVSEKVESYNLLLTRDDKASLKARTIAREEAVAEIDAHKAESDLALDAAAMSVNTMVGNIKSSIESLHKKLDTDIQASQIMLADSAKKAEAKVVKHSKASLDDMQKLGLSLFQEFDVPMKLRVSEFESSGKSTLESGLSELSKLNTILKTTTSTTVNQAADEITKNFSEVSNELEKSLGTDEEQLSDLTEQLTTLVNTISRQVLSNRDSAFEKSTQRVLEANQQAARKFESIGLALKTQISNRSYQISEQFNGEVSDTSTKLANSVTQEISNVNDTVSNIKQTRTESLNKIDVDVDKALRRWMKSSKDNLDKGLSTIRTALGDVATETSDAIKMIQSINEAASAQMNSVPTESWYITGADEICTHVSDMASRAEKSILISTPSLDCIDIKKLNKVKTPRRKILVLPPLEDASEELTTLRGWRIWQVPRPILLAVRDESEILLSGQDQSESTFAIASVDEVYLKLFHDILGPMLTDSRIVTS